MNTEILNKIAKLINSNDKNEVISFAIKFLTEQGMPVAQAYDAILGDGAYDQMKGIVYDSLKNA